MACRNPLENETNTEYLLHGAHAAIGIYASDKIESSSIRSIETKYYLTEMYREISYIKNIRVSGVNIPHQADKLFSPCATLLKSDNQDKKNLHKCNPSQRKWHVHREYRL
jgi:hypothetical protein